MKSVTDLNGPKPLTAPQEPDQDRWSSSHVGAFLNEGLSLSEAIRARAQQTLREMGVEVAIVERMPGHHWSEVMLEGKRHIVDPTWQKTTPKDSGVLGPGHNLAQVSYRGINQNVDRTWSEDEGLGARRPSAPIDIATEKPKK